MDAPLPEYLARDETAQLLSCSAATIDRLARNDPTFPAPAKFGGLVRYKRSALLDYLRACETREPIAARTRKASRPTATPVSRTLIRRRAEA
jgi:predicted DNA-binding transcriptional regulator AlpA